MSVTPASASPCRAARSSMTVNARYYFGQPVRNADVHYVVEQRAVLFAAALGRRADTEARGGGFYGGDDARKATVTLGADGRGQIRRDRSIPTTTAATTGSASRRASSDASGREVTGSRRRRTPPWGDSWSPPRAAISTWPRPGATVALSMRAVDYLGSGRRRRAGARRWSSGLEYPRRLLQRREVTVMQETAARTDADGRARDDDHRAAGARQLPRGRGRPRQRPRRARRRLRCGCRAPTEAAGDGEQRLPRTDRRQAQLRAGRHGASGRARPRRRRGRCC